MLQDAIDRWLMMAGAKVKSDVFGKVYQVSDEVLLSAGGGLGMIGALE